MRGCGFGEPGETHGLVHRLLNDGLVKVVAVSVARRAVAVVRGGREDVLPAPVAVGVFVLARERKRERRAAEVVSQVVLCCART